MRAEALLEEIPVDGLGGRGALACGNDHLAFCRRQTSGCIETLHLRVQIRIHDDLTKSIERCFCLFRQCAVVDISTACE